MATKKTGQAEPKGYAEAMREVELILSELDSNSVDVDVLAVKVERASFLINWCSDRVTSAQMTVDSLVADMADFVVAESDDDDSDDEEEDDEDFDDDDDD